MWTINNMVEYFDYLKNIDPPTIQETAITICGFLTGFGVFISCLLNVAIMSFTWLNYQIWGLNTVTLFLLFLLIVSIGITLTIWRLRDFAMLKLDMWRAIDTELRD